MSIAVATLDYRPYMVGSRPRLYMACIKAAHGGQAACNEWMNNCDHIIKHRLEQGEPTPLTGDNGILTDEVLEEAKEAIVHSSKTIQDILLHIV